MTKGEIDGPLRAKALLGHYLGGFQHRIEVALVVPGAATPDKPVGDDAIERRLLPVVLRAGRDRHHVLMGEQSDRRRLCVRTLPLVEQAILRDQLALGRSMKGGKAFQDVRLQAAKGVAALIRIFETRNGAEADRLAQPSRRARLVDRRSWDDCNLKLLRGAREHIEREHAGENEDCRDQQQRDIADYSDQSAHGDYLSLARFVVGVFVCCGFAGDQRPLGLAAFPRLSRDRKEQSARFSASWLAFYCSLARATPSRISLWASSAPPHRNTLTH